MGHVPGIEKNWDKELNIHEIMRCVCFYFCLIFSMLSTFSHHLPHVISFLQCGTTVSIWLGAAYCVERGLAWRSGICLLPCWRVCGEGVSLPTCCPNAGEYTTASCLTQIYNKDLNKQCITLNTSCLKMRDGAHMRVRYDSHSLKETGIFEWGTWSSPQ